MTTPASQSLQFKCECQGHAGPARAEFSARGSNSGQLYDLQLRKVIQWWGTSTPSSFIWLQPTPPRLLPGTSGPLYSLTACGKRKFLACLLPAISFPAEGKLCGRAQTTDAGGQGTKLSLAHWGTEGSCTAAVCSLENANRKPITQLGGLPSLKHLSRLQLCLLKQPERNGGRFTTAPHSSVLGKLHSLFA